MGTAANFTHDLDDNVARLARKRVSRKLGWYVHAFVFVTVNLGLAALARGTTGMTTAKSALRAGNYGPLKYRARLTPSPKTPVSRRWFMRSGWACGACQLGATRCAQDRVAGGLA